jgi:hypothetical protein
VTAHPITSAAELAALNEQMAGDNGHSCYRPTHILRDSAGRTVGAFSITFAPVLFFWMDTRTPSPLASLRALKLAVSTFRALGHERIILPCQPDSPFYRYMGTGIIGHPCNLGSFDLFVMNDKTNPTGEPHSHGFVSSKRL